MRPLFVLISVGITIFLTVKSFSFSIVMGYICDGKKSARRFLQFDNFLNSSNVQFESCNGQVYFLNTCVSCNLRTSVIEKSLL